MKFNNQNGRSMIEMLGVLAIIGVLSVGGIAGYSKAMDKYKTNKLIDEVISVAHNIKTLCANQKKCDLDYENDSIVELVFSKKKHRRDFDLFESEYGGNIFFSQGISSEHDYTIYVDGLSKEACEEIAVQSWQNIFEMVELGTNIYGHDLSTAYSDACIGKNTSSLEGTYLACKNEGKLPISPKDAAYGCDCDNSIYGTRKECSIVFTVIP